MHNNNKLILEHMNETKVIFGNGNILMGVGMTENGNIGLRLKEVDAHHRIGHITEETFNDEETQEVVQTVDLEFKNLKGAEAFLRMVVHAMNVLKNHEEKLGL